MKVSKKTLANIPYILNLIVIIMSLIFIIINLNKKYNEKETVECFEYKMIMWVTVLLFAISGIIINYLINEK